MHSPYEMQIAENAAHQEQLRHEAEQARMANTYRDDNHTPIYGPVLARTGKMMVNIGKRLQDRYGEAMDELTAPVNDGGKEQHGSMA